MKRKIMCFLGFHKYEKYMGPQNLGDGKFLQKINLHSLQEDCETYKIVNN